MLGSWVKLAQQHFERLFEVIRKKEKEKSSHDSIYSDSFDECGLEGEFASYLNLKTSTSQLS